MSAYSYWRGHRMVWDGRHWVFADNGKLPGDAEGNAIHSLCPRCGKPPTPEGYDACLGRIPGAVAACCGHGVEPGYVMFAHKGSETS